MTYAELFTMRHAIVISLIKYLVHDSEVGFIIQELSKTQTLVNHNRRKAHNDVREGLASDW